MSSNTFAVDALTRHQIYLQRYSTGEVKKMLPLLSQMLKDIQVRMSLNSTEFMFQRLSELDRDIRAIIQASMTRLDKQLLLDLTDFGEYEAAFANNMLNKMVNLSTVGVSVDQIAAAISNTPMSLLSGDTYSNMTVSQAINQFSRSTSSTLAHTINAGIAEGMTTAKISDNVTRIVKNRTAAQAEALIRTAANHAGTAARNKVFQENDEVLAGEEFTATLDSKTSLTCGNFDGQIFPVGEGAMPPLHFNCRSIRVPVVDPEFTVVKLRGERASFGADGRKPVSTQTTYGGWLRKQPAAFQNDALGRDRAKLFRNGKLSIGKFSDESGIAYSLDELRELEPRAFMDAGLD